MTARSHRDENDGEVTLVIEQLRRPTPGGIGTYTRELIHGLTRCKDSETLSIRLFASRPPHGKDPLRELPFDLRTSIFPGPMMTRLWDRGHAGPPGSGIVHALSLCAPSTADPLIVTVHDLAFRELPDTFTPHGRAWHEAAFLRAAKTSRYLVVPSEEVGEALLGARAGITADRVRVIAEGADHLPDPDQTGTTALLNQLGVDGRFILSVGTLEPRKNLNRLIEAFGQLRGELGDPVQLVICGPMGWAVNLSAPAGVAFAGQVAEGVLAGLYARAEVVAYVPLSEGFGLPVVEAMHAGAVVVSSRVPSARQGALIVDPYDVSAIADGLAKAMADEQLRAQLRGAADSYSATLTWENTARQHCALWNEVMNR